MKNVSFTKYELKKLLNFYNRQYKEVLDEAEDTRSKLDDLKTEQKRREDIAEQKRIEEEKEAKSRAAKEKSEEKRTSGNDQNFKDIAREIRELPWDELILVMLRQTDDYMTPADFLNYSFDILHLPKSHKEVINKEISKALASLKNHKRVETGKLEGDTEEIFYGLPEWFE